MTGLARLALPFPQIAAGLGLTTVVLGGLLYVQGLRMHAAKVERDQLAREAVRWEQAFKTQQQSIADLRKALDDSNEKVRALEASYTQIARQSVQDVAVANARQRTMQTKIEKLNRIVQTSTGGRDVPDDLIAALEGL